MWIAFSISAYYIIQWCISKIKICNVQDKYVLITGCDSGFGKATAIRLHSVGFNVIAACLTKEGADYLTKTCSTKLRTILLNVTSEDDIKKAVKTVKEIIPLNKGLWALVNNAGVSGLVGLFETTTRKDFLDCYKVNLFGLIDVTRSFLPLLRKGQGRVVNLSSITGRFSQIPIIYSTGKYALEGFSDCLRREVYSHGVSVYIIEPGFYNTGILTIERSLGGLKNAFYKSRSEIQEYYGQKFLKKLCDYMSWELNRATSDIEPVIRDIQRAVSAKYPQYRYLSGLDAQFKFRFMWTIPTWLSDFLYNVIFPSPDKATWKIR
ncbi:hypothetical protein LOTGIDRAFT_141736 [Lottia gigantea]|uniref:Uncharacterized protein n=1 Tax=Lottia gigantea TaxID=225164 RepID=V4A6X8_LOTGI|nr:hypothetical protein LOTGIDRAFT_141736 [Lottia gigantea]ESO99688.1 hypothetical protein LOTGIDRAFT_141736 [Lottia gigantea]